MIVMPLFHVAGTNISFAGLANGSCVVIVRDFTPRDALAMMQRDGISHTFIAPAMILMLLQAPEMAAAHFPKLKTIAYGASPISEEVLNRAKAGFGCGFVQFYGMTESTGAGAYLSPQDHLRADKLRSCGKAWPDVDIRIVDGQGAPAPVGAVGEIAIRGDIVMRAYWNNETATSAAVREGWYLTGDAGYLDDEGFLYIHDRMKDLIITGGENVYPAEVENAIHGCPGVADVAVVGVPSERWGEEVKAIVVAHPAESPSGEAVIAYARERIAGFKAPKSVDFIDVLPRNASGKILRRTLREPYWRGHGRGIG
jgi:acyl-CoA synthetase (AMP-forming)/AMP-acid ligase II